MHIKLKSSFTLEKDLESCLNRLKYRDIKKSGFTFRTPLSNLLSFDFSLPEVVVTAITI